MPRVTFPDGSSQKCRLTTTAMAWRRSKALTPTVAIARHAAMSQIVNEVETAVQTGALPAEDFWDTIFARVTAVPDPAAPPAAPAPAAAAAAAAPLAG